MVDRFEPKVIVSGIGQSQVARRIGRDPLLLTADACLAAIADAGLEPGDIDGLSTYPGSSQPGPGFSGGSIREVHDLLGLHPQWVSGGIELPGQAGAIVNAMLAVAGGIANHVLCWRSIWEGTAQGQRRPQGVRRGCQAGRRSVRVGAALRRDRTVARGDAHPGSDGPLRAHARAARRGTDRDTRERGSQSERRVPRSADPRGLPQRAHDLAAALPVRLRRAV